VFIGWRFSIILISALFVLDALLNAHSGRASQSDLHQALKQEIAKRYYGAKVELTAPVRWMKNAEPAEINKIIEITEGGRADLRFRVIDKDEKVFEGTTAFSAAIPAWIANRRIQPGEKLSRELFSLQEVNVASGMGREYRGVILSPGNFKATEMNMTESRQTILEGQFLASTAIQKSPAIRRGDSVTIRIESGGLQLSTNGIAQEAAYLNGQVRVLTNKSKRELTGSLRVNGLVEVRL